MSKNKTFTSSEAKKIGESLGINWSKFNVEQFKIGMMVELEHGSIDPDTNVTDNDSLVTGKIALAHLSEYPDYYTRLEKMEDEAEEYWAKKLGKDVSNKKIYTGENDEEVLNCEGNPCNFVYDDTEIEKE
ncbi:DUF5661 family protein [Clostridium psychrophilum]|uniref:DUF5661 family protein n=1 Tax=Clostridium psychrophilum TaxID=132926 RepID=UPI001FE91B85|nr:DUF5661 family protein [Clostridium psychrophilum]